MRRWLSFDVEGATCAATLDEAPGSHGLLVVSGGNEVRSGAHRGMAQLAAAIAGHGHPVLRFDRRGIGDSEGVNAGFEGSGPDIRAALRAFRAACPQLCTVTAFGNCDAAAALLLQDPLPEDVSFLLLANPWTLDAADGGGPDPAAVRARYGSKLRDPREWRRLLTGGVNLGKLGRGLRSIVRGSATKQGSDRLADRIAAALRRIDDRNMTILLVDGDRTADAFSRLWTGPQCDAVRARPWVQVHRHPGGSHSFADEDARDWLTTQVLAAIRR